MKTSSFYFYEGFISTQPEGWKWKVCRVCFPYTSVRHGGFGDDIIDAGNDNDWIEGGEGNDNITAGFGDDVVNGGAGNDVLRDDSFISELSDNDQFNGGAGDDIYSFKFNIQPSGSLLLNQNTSSGYGQANNITTPNNDMSVLVSFNQNDPDAPASDTFFHVKTAQYHRTLQVSIGNASQLVVYFANTKYDTNYILNEGEDHNILFNWDKSAGEIEIYHNDQSIYSRNVSTSISFDNTGTMMLGQYLYPNGTTVDPTWDFEGEIYELTIWDQRLSASEISADPNRDTALHYFPFNSDGAGSAINETGNSNITLYGDTEWVSNEDNNIMSAEDSTSVSLNRTAGIGYGLVNNISMPENAISVFASFIHDSTDSASDLIFQYYTAQSNKDIQLSLGGSNQLMLNIAGNQMNTGYILSGNELHEILFTWDASSGQVNIHDNDQLIYSHVLSTNVLLNDTGTLSLGQFQTSQGIVSDGVFDFDGEIKELSIWDQVLTLADIQADPTRATAMHHYDFDDLEGTAVTNHSGNSDMILYGDFAWIGHKPEKDFISDVSGNDTILIEDNITIDELMFWRSIDNENSLIISLYDQSGMQELQSITIEDHFYDQPVENITFADGSSVVMSDLTIQLDGNVEDNILRGTDQKDKIYGHDGNDKLFGFEGDDILIAGAGIDTLQGDGGADSFVFEGVEIFDGNINTITDFNADEGDIIELLSVLEGYDPLTDAINDFVILTSDANDTIVSVDRDGSDSTYATEQILVVENTSEQWIDAQDMLTEGRLMIA